MSPFAGTPCGSVLNSFSEDMDCVDEQLWDEMYSLLFDGTVLGTVNGVVVGLMSLIAIMSAVLGISSACCFWWWYCCRR